MSAAELEVNRPHFGQVYMWSLVTAGAAITLVSIYYFPLRQTRREFCLPLFDGDCEFDDRNPDSASQRSYYSRRHLCFSGHAYVRRGCGDSAFCARRYRRDGRSSARSHGYSSSTLRFSPPVHFLLRQF